MAVYTEREMRAIAPETSLYRTTRIVWYIFYALEILLLFRFALKLLEANSGAGFTQFIYSLSSVPLSPFRFVFPANAVAGNVFEWSTLLAMVVYWVVAWGIVKLVAMNRRIDPVEASVGLEKQDEA